MPNDWESLTSAYGFFMLSISRNSCFQPVLAQVLSERPLASNHVDLWLLLTTTTQQKVWPTRLQSVKEKENPRSRVQ